MMLIKPAAMDSPNYLDQTSSVSFPNMFLSGCHLYQQGHYERACECFRKVVEKNEKSLYYESRFNLGACLFKMAEFKQALLQFTTLLNEQKQAADKARDSNSRTDLTKKVFRKFVGRDRRLYFNKALCELQMGLFDQAIATCKAYLKPVK